MSTPDFNPDIPLDDSLIVAGELRGQFVCLDGQCQTLHDEVENRCSKPAAVDPLAQTISDPPTQAEVQSIQDKLNELLAALNT